MDAQVKLHVTPQARFDYATDYINTHKADWKSVKLNVPVELFHRRLYVVFAADSITPGDTWTLEGRIAFWLNGAQTIWIPFMNNNTPLITAPFIGFPALNLNTTMFEDSLNVAIGPTPAKYQIAPQHFVTRCDAIEFVPLKWSYAGGGNSGKPSWFFGCQSQHIW